MEKEKKLILNAGRAVILAAHNHFAKIHSDNDDNADSQKIEEKNAVKTFNPK